METLVSIHHLSKKYGNVLALNDVDLDINSGEIIGLLGPNGSGKTTLIKILNGLLASYEGSVLFNNEKVGVYSKNLISYLPDEPYFAKWMKVKDAITIFKDFYKDFDVDKCNTLLNKFEINPKSQIKALSKGMQEKFQLALVMSRSAKLLILDEPLGGVDPAARELILKTILDNRTENQTILLSTHLISDIETIFDRVLFLKNGKLILNEEANYLRESTGKSVDELFREEFRCY